MARVIRAAIATAAALACVACDDVVGSDPSAAAAVAEHGLPPADRALFRLARLESYFQAASRVTEPKAAAALAAQGMVEAYDGAPGGLAGLGLDEAALRAAAVGGTRIELDAALATLAAARVRAAGDGRTVARAMVGLAAELYAAGLQHGGVDRAEYQTSLGAALEARALLPVDAANAHAATELDRFAALWPSPEPPPRPTPAPSLRDEAAHAAALLKAP